MSKSRKTFSGDMIKFVVEPATFFDTLRKGIEGYRVISVDGDLLVSNRTIFMTLSTFGTIDQLYYMKKNQAFAQPYAICNRWNFTVNDITYNVTISGSPNYQIDVRSKMNEVTSKPANPLLPLEVGKYYRTRNNTKVKIVADCGNEFAGTYYVGLFTQGKDTSAIRYSRNGCTSSHGQNDKYDIVEEWVEKDHIWIVMYWSNEQVATITVHQEHLAKQYEEKFKSKKTFIRTEKLKITTE